jgi:hypothetical protein
MTVTNFVILSSAYVGADLTAEFGLLPPSFLPFGHQRLFERQIKFAKQYNSRITLTLPNDFEVQPSDRRLLSEESVNVIFLPPSHTLRTAALGALTQLGALGRTLILFGDTLVELDAHDADTFAVGRTSHLAVWGGIEQQNGSIRFHETLTAGCGNDVVSGLFDFSDGEMFKNNLSQEHCFYDALNAYSTEKNLNPVKADKWFDFGHLHTLFQSKRAHLETRAFNSIVGDGHLVKKTGNPSRKIYAEAQWFENLPLNVRPFVPEYLGSNSDPEFSYTLNYLYLPLLSEILVFGTLPIYSWHNIFKSCHNFLQLLSSHKPNRFELPFNFEDRFYQDIIASKTETRVREFFEKSSISEIREWNFNGRRAPSLRRIIDSLLSIIRSTTYEDIGIWHGDFHLANIFFDFRSQQIKVIDPRGMLHDGSHTMYGDIRYDLAKLTHSVLGCYDFILAKRFDLDIFNYDITFNIDTPENYDEIINEFLGVFVEPFDAGGNENIAMTAILFLSMIPLHSEDEKRQMALLANALRLAEMAGVY